MSSYFSVELLKKNFDAFWCIYLTLCQTVVNGIVPINHYSGYLSSGGNICQHICPIFCSLCVYWNRFIIGKIVISWLNCMKVVFLNRFVWNIVKYPLCRVSYSQSYPDFGLFYLPCFNFMEHAFLNYIKKYFLSLYTAKTLS